MLQAGARERASDFAGVALGIDARERIFFPAMAADLGELERDGMHPEIIFLDASDEVLARRYSETRRPHPLAQSGRQRSR